ncbi:MAG: MmcQ/YjbR family DNA-binding protein [Acidimicrobiales bacterium]
MLRPDLVDVVDLEAEAITTGFRWLLPPSTLRGGMAKAAATRRFERLSAMCLTLPEASQSGDQHTAFRVRGRTFAYYLVDHHGDGRIALCCKADPGENQALIESDPERFFMPPYIGPRGWVGLDLDARPVDRTEIRELVFDSYRLVAPKSLAKLVTADARTPSSRRSP